MGDEVRVTVIAAGFDRWDDSKASPRRIETTPSEPASKPAERSSGGIIREVFAEEDDESLFEPDDDFDVPSFLK